MKGFSEPFFFQYCSLYTSYWNKRGSTKIVFLGPLGVVAGRLGIKETGKGITWNVGSRSQNTEIPIVNVPFVDCV
jgi:hypothetical protein